MQAVGGVTPESFSPSVLILLLPEVRGVTPESFQPLPIANCGAGGGAELEQ